MDDTVTTIPPEDAHKYTMTLSDDGAAAFRLNCNRGTTQWKAEPSSADSGQLEFSAVATTRALCPPPSFDERIARDLEYVRTYLIKEDLLYLSLMADGGIYAWSPIPRETPDSL